MKRSQLTVSVIIPAKDEAAKIDACLRALKEQTVGWSRLDVLVIDDGSQDGTSEIAEQHAACVIRQPHAGAASARNRGIREAKGDILIFMDADCIPKPDFIERLTEVFLNRDRSQEVIGALGIYQTSQKGILACLIQAELDEAYEKLQKSENVDFANTGAVAYRREVLIGQHGFREDFRKLEDIELSYRLTRRGAKIAFVPTAIVNHHHADTWLQFLKTKFYYGFYSVRLFATFPKKAAIDSRTSNARKFQVVFAFMIACTALTAPFWGPARPLLILLLLTFVASTFGFSSRVWRRNRRAAIFAPLYLFGNTLSFAAGFVLGSALWAVGARHIAGRAAPQRG